MQRQHRDQAQDGVRMGTVPLFTPTLPPKITSISHEFLAKWKINRREYEAELRARRRLQRRIIEPFDADLLDTFCDLRLHHASADVTEGMLIAGIDHIAGSITNFILPDRKLRFNMTEENMDARVLDYFNTFGQVILLH
ncbi:unnamed protein product [Phytophthora fragariaefolia]|uniref:Unnamed protein product n=1 Tax=Phytophthora fragariaefolia TaxID=1490495 RepID=A0A9W6TWP6_9STRA|nr:unnamed protein product [Phytophthora fragariaefolia]